MRMCLVVQCEDWVVRYEAMEALCCCMRSGSSTDLQCLVPASLYSPGVYLLLVRSLCSSCLLQPVKDSTYRLTCCMLDDTVLHSTSADAQCDCT